jgi:hypothetical protein
MAYKKAHCHWISSALLAIFSQFTRFSLVHTSLLHRSVIPQQNFHTFWPYKLSFSSLFLVVAAFPSCPVVCEGQEGDAVREYGLGVRNNRGQRLTGFCKEKELIITNTIFQQHPRHRCTWVQPGDRARYQIDYIMVKKKQNTRTTKQNIPGSWYTQRP